MRCNTNPAEIITRAYCADTVHISIWPNTTILRNFSSHTIILPKIYRNNKLKLATLFKIIDTMRYNDTKNIVTKNDSQN